MFGIGLLKSIADHFIDGTWQDPDTYRPKPAIFNSTMQEGAAAACTSSDGALLAVCVDLGSVGKRRFAENSS